MEYSLTNLALEREAIIVKLEGGHGFQRRLRTMGVREGKIVKVVAKHPFGGPVVLEVDGRRTTVGRGMAAKIFVEELKE